MAIATKTRGAIRSPALYTIRLGIRSTKTRHFRQVTEAVKVGPDPAGECHLRGGDGQPALAQVVARPDQPAGDRGVDRGEHLRGGVEVHPRRRATRLPGDEVVVRPAEFVGRGAETLGARPVLVFRRIIFPALLPALITGTAMAFSRALGEYGSVIFIAGNIPMVSEIVPLVIMTKLEQFQYVEAAVVAVFMLLLSFAMMFVINGAQLALQRRHQAKQ